MKNLSNTIGSMALKGKAWIFSIMLMSTQLVSAQTVVDVIVNSPDHTTLEAAVIAAELDGTLSGTGPFTVFAPTDAAFDALPAGSVEALLANIPALTEILTYHVVGSQALSTDLSDGMEITTLNGKDVTVTIDESGVKINGVSMVITADLMADNGVVHVIDAVLLPDESTSIREDFRNAAASLSIYPNPASSEVHFTFSLPSTQAVSVEIYNTFGQLIKTVNYGALQVGSNSISQNVSDLSSGIYMIIVTTGSDKTVSKLQIRK
ncbi:fasciclin domain-containing protein [Geofilum rubicundum]|uniref:Secreted and surface protein containing fasciclin-like repeats n=1 Tax=Geofilum rubicundum JCM 15548 TaxID=1236989 RepID=A0A0E9M3Z0_9BACT|nr:fasciclin domain-containing protein [Geofilum rubicundum]GAO31885.1 secreted and surface protein containing fasciclin-like repeats [Geofilum rubicundum JCM 15548]